MNYKPSITQNAGAQIKWAIIVMAIIGIIALLSSCTKEKTITETKTNTIDNTKKLNPSNCKVIEVRQNGVLNRKEFWTGESMDSTHNYNLDGLRSFNAYHIGYMSEYQVSTQYNNSNGQMLGKQETWRDREGRVIKSKQYNGNGEFIGGYDIAYTCE